MNKYKEKFINFKDKDQKRKSVSFSMRDQFLGLQYEKRGMREQKIMDGLKRDWENRE